MKMREMGGLKKGKERKQINSLVKVDQKPDFTLPSSISAQSDHTQRHTCTCTCTLALIFYSKRSLFTERFYKSTGGGKALAEN